MERKSLSFGHVVSIACRSVRSEKATNEPMRQKKKNTFSWIVAKLEKWTRFLRTWVKSKSLTLKQIEIEYLSNLLPKMVKFAGRRLRDNSTTLPIGPRHASFDVDAAVTSSSANDPNVPVVYQMIKAEVQNLLDKMTNAQTQDVVESATKIRDKALLLKSPVKLDVPAGTLFPAEDLSPASLAYSSTGQQANRLVNELSIRRKEELKLFRSLSCGAKSTEEASNGARFGKGSTITLVALKANGVQTAIMPVILEQDENEELSHNTKSRKIIEGVSDGGGARLTMQEIPNVVLNLGNVPSTSDVVGLASGGQSQNVRKLTVDGVQNDGQVIDILIEAARADHLIPLEELEIKLNTSKDLGLNNRQVQIHRQRDGPNILKQKSVTPAWLHFLKSLIGGFGAVLWLAALLCFLAYWPLGDPPDRYNLVLGMALLAVIFVQSYFSFRQERKASNLIAGFLNMMPTSCQVLRNGSWIFVPAQDLVVGDVIRVKEGDKVPADVRIFEVNEAKIEKSSLTGESEPVSLSPHPTDRNIYETQNMALFGTSVLEGTAAGLVINTGDRTVMGKIAQMTCSTKSVKTTLQREIEHFLIVVAVLSVFTCALTLLVFYFVIDKAHPGFLSTAVMLTNCIAITVAVLPDGLPISTSDFRRNPLNADWNPLSASASGIVFVTPLILCVLNFSSLCSYYQVTTILTLVGRRLHREMILVKDFSITETLGSATLIASDKTGTITMNRMTLNHLWVGCRRSSNTKCQELGHGRLARKQSLVYDESSVDYLEKIVPGCYNFDNMGKTVEDPAVAFLLQLMCMCNKASFETPSGRQAAKWRKNLEVEKIVGTPTEGALLSASQSFFDVSKFRLKVPIVDEIPFNSRRKFHLTVHKIVDDSVFHTTEFSIRQKPTEDHGDHETDRDRKSNFSYYHSESEYRIVSPDGHENLINDEDDSLLLTPRNAAGKKGGVGIVQKRDFNFLAVVKGAPEYILGMCARAVFDGREEQLKPDSISQIMKANEKLAAEGERVLAFAFKRLSSEQYPLNHVFDLRLCIATAFIPHKIYERFETSQIRKDANLSQMFIACRRPCSIFRIVSQLDAHLTLALALLWRRPYFGAGLTLAPLSLVPIMHILRAINGRRLLNDMNLQGLASQKFTHEIEEETKNFTLLGLVGIIDPPRPGVADAIKECHEAGIRVIMVTGDHPTTAVAISRMVNIITNRKVKNYDDILEFSCNSDEREFCNDIKVECSNKMLNLIYEKMRQTLGRRPERRFLKESLVIAGKDLHNLNEKQWDYVLSHREIVFARTTPQQKLQIVKESQKRGDIIAVTGSPH
uniref:Cation-transporting P-type ATPase N-terminal domain-containing protein n=1 Tax=Romanomermis culicivorax TaxID=13658 RepID=A0A915IQM6_ROMCU